MLTLIAASLLVAAEPSRPVIAVLYFDNNSTSADLDVMRKGLADMIVTDLVAWDGVTVVEREKLETVLGELKLQQSKRFDPTTAVKVGKLIGAQYNLTGAMQLEKNELRLDARLIKVEGGSAVGSASVRGEKDKIFDLEQELVLKLTATIDAKLRDDKARKKSKVPDFQSLVAYSKAIDLNDQGKLDEAQAAMQALVSKSPTFLMAREKKQQYLDALKEFEKRRKDMTTDSVVQLGRLADEALKQEAGFDALDEKAKRTFLSMRVIKGRVMLRVAKQLLSWRRERLRIPLKGKEAQAIAVMRAWLENQRRLIDERDRYMRLHSKVTNGITSTPSTSTELSDEVQKLARDAKLGDLGFDGENFDDLLAFVLDGRARDGEDTFTIAPALGDLDPKEQKATFEQLDQRVDAAISAHAKAPAGQQSRLEWQAIRLLDRKAEALARLDRDDDAIAAWQKVLDTFPTSSSAPQAERHIKQLLGAEHDHSRDVQERWAKALTSCDDMDIRVGMGTLDRKVRRMGLQGLGAQAAELEKGCKPTPKNRNAFAYMYKDLAMEAANHEDCDAFRGWFKKYVEADGAISDMLGYQKNYTPWCELGDVTKQVLWFTALLDGSWTLDCDRNLSGIVSYDQKVYSLNATNSKTNESLHFRLERDGAGWKCVLATWDRQPKARLEGTCDVKLTKLAAEKGEFDEGTFSASFVDKAEGSRTLQLGDGKFRVRRN